MTTIRVYEYAKENGFTNVRDGKFTRFSKNNPEPEDIKKAFGILNRDGNVIVEFDGWEYYQKWKNEEGTGRIYSSPIDDSDFDYSTTINEVVRDILMNYYED